VQTWIIIDTQNHMNSTDKNEVNSGNKNRYLVCFDSSKIVYLGL